MQRRRLERKNMSWDTVREYLELQNDLCEIDLRSGEIDRERGIFAQLERSGVLRHSIPGIGSVSQAMTEPPLSNRARIHPLAAPSGASPKIQPTVATGMRSAATTNFWICRIPTKSKSVGGTATLFLLGRVDGQRCNQPNERILNFDTHVMVRHS
jgi:hypothetical protein